MGSGRSGAVLGGMGTTNRLEVIKYTSCSFHTNSNHLPRIKSRTNVHLGGRDVHVINWKLHFSPSHKRKGQVGQLDDSHIRNELYVQTYL